MPDAPPDVPSRRRLETGVLALVAGLPIVVLVAVLAHRNWYPTGDLAQAELRVRSLPHHPPLLGAAGRIEDLEHRQGNHPGPLMFWVTWPFYVVLGRSSWAFEAATALVNLAWLATATWLVRRRASVGVAMWFVAVALVLAGGFGLDGLSQPWNPWVALFPYAVLVLTAWRALDGWRWAPVLGVAAASYAIQGHVGYAPVALPLVAVSVLGPVWAWWRSRAGHRAHVHQTDEERHEAEAIGAAAALGVDLEADDRIHARTALRSRAPAPEAAGTIALVAGVLVAVVVGVAGWIGPLWDALTSHPSNVHKLLDNFGHPTDPPIGLVEGTKVLLRGLSPTGAWVHGGVLLGGSVLPGLLLVVAWFGVAVAVVGGRREHRALVQLDAVLAGSLVFGLVAVSRIFGVPFLYTYRWIAVLAAFLVFSLGWGVALLVPRPKVTAAQGRTVLAVGLAVLLGGSVATAVRVSGQEIPYPYSWRQERVLAPATAAKLPKDRRYLVDWDDNVYLGGLGFGLLLDLERRGYAVGAKPEAEAAVEPHRVLCPGQYDAVLTVVTGPQAIARWKAKPGTKLLATAGSDPGFDYARTFRALRRAVAATGNPSSADAVEARITGLVLNATGSPEAGRLAAELVRHGVPGAVFLQDPAPPAPPVPHDPRTEACW